MHRPLIFLSLLKTKTEAKFELGSMQGPNTSRSSTKFFKQAFLKNLLQSLACLHPRTTAMSLHDRKLAIKSAADVAMAAARSAASSGAGDVAARWPKAILLASASARIRRRSSIVVRSSSCRRRRKRTGSNFKGSSSASGAGDAVDVTRTKVMALREVIPGGRDASAAAMDDEASLLKEAVDYVVHLRAQVDVLRRVSEVAALQRSG